MIQLCDVQIALVIVRYATAGIVGVFISPLVFVKLGLAEEAANSSEAGYR